VHKQREPTQHAQSADGVFSTTGAPNAFRTEATSIAEAKSIPWWREPSKDQWLAWFAAWLGWVLDVFDFGVFMLVMVPIAAEFHLPLSAVAFVLTVTLWLRLVGAVISGWAADRIGRKTPLMVSILVYSLSNFAAGLAPSYWLLLLFRGIFGLGMGAEWPVGAALAMESWPARSRGLMSAMLQAASNVGFVLASVAYGFLFGVIGWRGLLIIGVMPALFVMFVRTFVKESPVWLKNRQIRNAEKRQVASLVTIFRKGMLGNTLTTFWWIASSIVLYYSITALFATHLQKDLHLSPALVATPVALSNLLTLLASGFWGVLADRIGRRWAMIIPAVLGAMLAPVYLLSHNVSVIIGGFIAQGMFGTAVSSQQPSYLAERFPTEIRATATGFVFHSGAVVAGFVPLILTMISSNYGVGLGISMLVGTIFAAINVVLALLCGPETKGMSLDSSPALK
jgi:MFS transporter, SHS family, lactate transporter